jgi:hypothetical protein
VLLAHRNHPSFLSLALGNEFNLNWLKTEEERKEFLDTVAEFYSLAKKLDPARLILSNDGLVMQPTDMVSDCCDFSQDVPTVRHEFGSYYCSLPDVSLLDRFTGVIIPTWLEAKKRWVDASGLADRYNLYLRNSQRLQQLTATVRAQSGQRFGLSLLVDVDFPGGTRGRFWEEVGLTTCNQGITPAEAEINSPALLMINAGRRPHHERCIEACRCFA